MSSCTVACSSLCWGIPAISALIEREAILRVRGAEHIVEIPEGCTDLFR
jgi:hypothetical protein